MFAKVKDHENLVRDMNSKAILNTDKLALQEYYQKRDLAKKELSEKTESKQRLDKIENEMSEIKDLLRELIGRGK
jgi:t-SNARE complex subunit (syntaxin)